MATYEIDEETLDIPLRELGDKGSSFRTWNDPAKPFQRNNITQRDGAISIRCSARDVIHGYLKDGIGPATLLVYDFHFDPLRKARRIKCVDIEFYYYSTGDEEPEVTAIAPDGSRVLDPTTQTETVTQGGEAKLGANMFGADIGGSWKLEKTVSRETSDGVRLVGFMKTKHRNYGGHNAVSWNVQENETTERGVPSHLSTAVLLRRNSDVEQFQSTFEIRSDVDVVSKISRLFASVERDDPILYDPMLAPTNKLRQYDVNNLADVDLNKIGMTED